MLDHRAFSTERDPPGPWLTGGWVYHLVFWLFLGAPEGFLPALPSRSVVPGSIYLSTLFLFIPFLGA